MSKLTDKSYGVARKDGDFSFVGFAKKAKSDEAQKVDIYLDKELIDTINSDEYNQEIDDLYGADNLAFSYHLPFRYIDGKSHNLTFKVHGTDEQLRGSPLSVMEKSHKNFNEARFMRSLDEPLSEELKDMYCPNAIGFLATKENLEDEEFVEYIKELMIRFPNVEFKGFYFNRNEKIVLEKLNIENILISNITQITEKINLFIQTLKHVNLVPFLIKQDIYYIWFIKEAYNSNLTVYNYDSDKDPYHFKSFNYKDTEKVSDNYAINFRNKMNSNSNTELLSEIIYFERLKYYFESQKFKNFLLKK
ncbi:MAG: hypothetical protein WC144_03260 [Sulfurimonas sp.]|jgi:hypothetical protein|nr:hypothetical protein [Sulfurimonadaceae bacterium]